MKKFLLTVFAVAGLLVAAGNVSAIDLGITADATLVEAIGISKVANLRFGTFLLPAGAANVIMSGSIVDGGTCILTDITRFSVSSTPAYGPARVTLLGSVGQTYNVTLSAAPVTLVGPNDKSMTITAFNYANASGLFDVASKDIAIGATLSIPSGSEVGNYSGTFTVTANYI